LTNTSIDHQRHETNPAAGCRQMLIVSSLL
jgi:hypothetical protein